METPGVTSENQPNTTNSESASENLPTTISSSTTETIPTKSQIPPSTSTSNKKPLIFTLIFTLILLIFLGISGYFLYQKYLNPPPKPELVQEVQPSETPTPTLEATTATKATETHNTLGFNLLKTLSKVKTENVVISPLSISLAFSMVYNGAEADTKNQMAEVLQIDKISTEELNQENQSLSQNLKDKDPKVEIHIANSIWARQGVSFNQSFLDTNKTYYQAETRELDFSLPTAADTINDWVKTNTKNKIDSIVKPPIDPLMVMYLINAVYFKGTWNIEFDKKLTEEKDFITDNSKKIKADFMQQNRKDFLYFENESFQAINLPYGENKKLSMYIFLPKADLNTFSSKLNLDNWNTWLKSFEKKEGTLEFPRFKVEYETSLINPLKSLGMIEAFSSEADFSGIRSQKDIYISEARHKTFIEVNEEGTEAAAVTSIGIMETALIPEEEKPFYMNVDKPFFFAITDSDSGQILFSGFIHNPSEN